MNLGFSKLKSLFGGKSAAGAAPLPEFSGTSYGGAAAFGGLPDDYGNIGGLASYAGEFDSLPSDYGAYSNIEPTSPSKASWKKKLKKGLASREEQQQPDITQGMQPVQPFRLTGGLLGGMR